MKGKSGVNFICPWAGNHSELGTTGGAKAGYRNSSPCTVSQLTVKSYPSTFCIKPLTLPGVPARSRGQYSDMLILNGHPSSCSLLSCL